MSKFLLLDCETTGLVRNRTLKLERQPEIIEFYACLANLKTGKVTKEFNSFLKPAKELSDTPAPGDRKTITEITGITNAMLKDAPTFKEKSAEIIKLIESAPCVIAHNASFDREMCDIEAERIGRKIKWPRVLCTVEQTISMKGYRLSLSALHQELFGEPFTGAHRAKIDVEALARCCKELLKRGIL
ncbi:MAG: 3'-5' exonuclease [Gammaproteobacteria bacterium]|nr:3'-5' exonuclease [Gammaproteobacteria bacterium]